MHLWLPTRFAFVRALWQRWEDWQLARAKKRDQKELDKRRAQKPVVTAKLVPANQSLPTSSDDLEPLVRRGSREFVFHCGWHFDCTPNGHRTDDGGKSRGGG